MQKKYYYVKIIFFLLIFLSNSGYAFEIKPIFKDDSNWLKDSLEWNDDDYSKNCDGNWYKLFNTQPVHEFITKNATLAFCISNSYLDSLKKANGHKRNNIFTNECSLKNGRLGNGDSSSNDPIISGSFFNDDPTGRLRREESGFWGKLVDYIKSMTFGTDMNTENSETYNSHNGSNQFMHAMQSNKEELTTTRNRIVSYIASNYNLAKYIDEKLRSDDTSTIDELSILLNQPIKPNGIYSFLISVIKADKEKGCKSDLNYGHLFYCGGSFEYGEHSKADYDGETQEEQVRSKARALALLSLGSALHVIQDSFSTSHVRRNRDNSGAIINFYKYSNEKNIPDLIEFDPQHQKHCQHDSSVEHNKKQIELSELKSKEFLMQVIPSITNGFSGKSCYEEMIGWLKDGIFKLASEEVSVSPNNLYQLNTCKPVSPSSIIFK